MIDCRVQQMRRCLQKASPSLNPIRSRGSSATVSRLVYLVELIYIHTEVVPSIWCRFSSPWHLSIDSTHSIWYKLGFCEESRSVYLSCHSRWTHQNLIMNKKSWQVTAISGTFVTITVNPRSKMCAVTCAVVEYLPLMQYLTNLVSHCILLKMLWLILLELIDRGG